MFDKLKCNLNFFFFKSKRFFNFTRQVYKTLKVQLVYKNFNSSIGFNIITFINNIFIIIKVSNKVMIKILCFIKYFLKDRGLGLTRARIKINVFKPGVSVRCLGFIIMFPRTQLNKFKKGKFKVYKTFFSSKAHFFFSKDIIYLFISKNIIKKQKLVLKSVLQRKIISQNIGKSLDRLNKIIRKFSIYFNLSLQARIQLKALSHYTFVRYQKLFFSKFKSKPKYKSYVRKQYVQKGTIKFKHNFLLKHENIKAYLLRYLFCYQI